MVSMVTSGYVGTFVSLTHPVPGGYAKWQGGAKGFLGFEIHDFGIVLGKKILASIFFGSLILLGILGVFKIMARFAVK